MKRLLGALTVGGLLLAGCGDDDTVVRPITDDPIPSGQNVVLRWNNAALQAIRDTKPGPPMTARALAIVHTCMYDAWAAYDDKAIGTRWTGELRRPESERLLGKKSKAISYAAYHALVDLYPSQHAKFETLMDELGYDADDATRDLSTPAGIGNQCAAVVISAKHIDGSNQLGELSGGTAYGDYTGYTSMNGPIKVTVPSTPEQFIAADHWQPLTFTNGAGVEVTPAFIAPQWGNVEPFAMTTPSQFRPVPPATLGSPQYREQAQALIDISANLTDEQKCIAEYWADGPNSELPPGHFNLFAQAVSLRDNHSLDEDVKMFFALTNAVSDAGIAVWDAKRFYDYCRPVTAIRYLFGGQTIHAWAGAGLGAQDIDGAAWKPFQPDAFPTPPFPEYPSGHSGFSAAAAEVLKRYTGSDAFDFMVSFPAHSLKAEPTSPSEPVMLHLATFSEAADQAGMSRRYGGIHFEQGDLVSRQMGRRCGAQAWARAEAFWKGEASRVASGELAGN